MNTSYTFPKLEQKDFSKIFAVLDAGMTPTYTLLLNNGKVSKTTNSLYQDKYAKIGERAYSGNKNEGSASAAAEKASYTYVENVTEIFKKTAEASATAIAEAKANGTDIIKDELQYSLTAMKADINHAIVKGTLSKEDPRATAGIVALAHADNKVVGTITKANIDALVNNVRKHAKGQLYMAISTADVQTVNDVLLAGRTINLNDGQEVIAGVSVVKYKSIYGPVVNIYVEDELEAGEVVVFDIAQVGVKVLRDFEQKEVAKDFDGERCEIVVELGAKANPHAIAVLAAE